MERCGRAIKRQVRGSRRFAISLKLGDGNAPSYSVGQAKDSSTPAGVSKPTDILAAMTITGEPCQPGSQALARFGASKFARRTRVVTPLALRKSNLNVIVNVPVPEKRRKTATLNLRIDPALKGAVERAAIEDRRSITSLVERLLTAHLKAQGFIAVEAAPAVRVARGAADAKGMANSAIDEALQHSTVSVGVQRKRRHALTEMPRINRREG